MRVYLAGPEVFLADRDAIAAEKKAICAQHGMIGVFPTDPAPGAPQADSDWMWIYLGNEAHIQGCDALIANLTPFRGASADPGTAYELGFMRALGRPVLGYSNAPGNFEGLVTLCGVGRAPTGTPRASPNGEVLSPPVSCRAMKRFITNTDADNVLVLAGRMRMPFGTQLVRMVKRLGSWRLTSA